MHFVQSYNGDVFTFENNSLVPKYHWDFGKQNFDISGLKDESYEFIISMLVLSVLNMLILLFHMLRIHDIILLDLLMIINSGH